MSNYSKLVGQVIGGILGIASGLGAQWALEIDAMYIDAISTLIGGAIGTYAAKPNRQVLSS